MAQKMSDATAIYMEQMAILEQARKNLWRELDNLWESIWGKISPQLDETLEGTGLFPHPNYWPNGSTPGAYWIHPKRTKDDNLCFINLGIYDPRVSGISGHYVVHLCSGKTSTGRKLLNQNPVAKKQMELLAKAENMVIDWAGTKNIWATSIPIDPTNLEVTEEQVGNEIVRSFSLLVEFNQWIDNNAPELAKHGRRASV